MGVYMNLTIKVVVGAVGENFQLRQSGYNPHSCRHNSRRTNLDWQSHRTLVLLSIDLLRGSLTHIATEDLAPASTRIVSFATKQRLGSKP